jgi:hyperosmotically inducible periplasmic protein
MRLWKSIVCIVCFVFLVGYFAAAPQSLAASSHSDMDLDRTLRSALSRNPALGRVEPEVQHGTVTLTGEVACYQDRLDAEAIAHQLPGVRSVESRITLTTPVIDDAELEDRVEDRLRYARADLGLIFSQIQVEARKGVVSLTGSVDDAIQHAAALSLVGTTDGVLSIKDGLSVDPSLSTDEATRTRINKAIYRAARASGNIGGVPVRAIFSVGSVTLMGAVDDNKTKEEFLSRVRDVSGVMSIEDEVIVRDSASTMRQGAASASPAPCPQSKEVVNAGR